MLDPLLRTLLYVLVLIAALPFVIAGILLLLFLYFLFLHRLPPHLRLAIRSFPHYCYRKSTLFISKAFKLKHVAIGMLPLITQPNWTTQVRATAAADLSKLCCRKGWFEDAERLAKQALGIKPDSFLAHSTLVTLHSALGHQDIALSLLKDVPRSENIGSRTLPRDFEIEAMRALIIAEHYGKSAARDSARRALEAYDDPTRQRILASLPSEYREYSETLYNGSIDALRQIIRDGT